MKDKAVDWREAYEELSRITANARVADQGRRQGWLRGMIPTLLRHTSFSLSVKIFQILMSLLIYDPNLPLSHTILNCKCSQSLLWRTK